MELQPHRCTRQPHRALAQRAEGRGVRAQEPRLGSEGEEEQVRRVAELRSRSARLHRHPGRPHGTPLPPQHEDHGAAMSAIRTRLSAMMFIQYFIYGSWLVTLGTFLGNVLHASGKEVGFAYMMPAIA